MNGMSGFWLLVVGPRKLIFCMKHDTQQEDLIFLYSGYHNIPEWNTTQLGYQVHLTATVKA